MYVCKIWTSIYTPARPFRSMTEPRALLSQQCDSRGSKRRFTSFVWFEWSFAPVGLYGSLDFVCFGSVNKGKKKFWNVVDMMWAPQPLEQSGSWFQADFLNIIVTSALQLIVCTYIPTHRRLVITGWSSQSPSVSWSSPTTTTTPSLV